MKVEHIMENDRLIHRIHEQNEKSKTEESDMNLTRILTKSADGEYGEQYFSTKQLQDFFIKNTDEEGNVTQDIVLFDEAEFEVNNEKDFKATEAKPGRIQMIMSDSKLDRSFERMDQTGWKLTNYKRNPVMLWAHQQRVPAVGIMEGVKVLDNKLIGYPKFDPIEIDPFAFMIGEKVRIRTLRGGSVGFKVLKVEVIENAKDGTRYVMREMELYEFSIVNVPMLPSALSQRVADETSEIDALKEMIEGNTQKTLEREKKLSEQIDGIVKKFGEELKASVKELDDLKTEVLSTKSENVNHLFDNKDQQTSDPPGQQTSDPSPNAQQTSGLEGIVSE